MTRFLRALQPTLQTCYPLLEMGGRELRVYVREKDVDDLAVVEMSTEIAAQISEEMTFPGQIKVNVIRETRATETGYGIALDGRPVRTPAKRDLVVPSSALARTRTLPTLGTRAIPCRKTCSSPTSAAERTFIGSLDNATWKTTLTSSTIGMFLPPGAALHPRRSERVLLVYVSKPTCS